ncbi:MAG: hypothetical protein P1U77_23220 [Rubripirellula sp.]|nr:hypothetical protein [Rubripirellula sp.]
MTAREVQRAGIVGINSAPSARLLLEDLTDAGFGNIEKANRKDSVTFTLNTT